MNGVRIMQNKYGVWLKKFWQREKFLIWGYLVYVVLSLNEDRILSLFGPLHCSVQNPNPWPEFLVTLLLMIVVDYVVRWAATIDWFGDKRNK